MEGKETDPRFYVRRHRQDHNNPSTPAATTATNTNATPTATATSTDGMFSNPHQQASSSRHYSSCTPYSVTGKAPVGASALPGVAKWRAGPVGRSRNYGPLEATVIASALGSDIFLPSSVLSPPAPRKTESFSTSSFSSPEKAPLDALANAGHGFIPHVITVAAGEDVAQKISLFVLQHKCEVCILAASGSISNASIRRPSVVGGQVIYEGHFEILSLSGSFQPTEFGGRTGGLSVSLSGSDGRIVGGGVGGCLTAAGPVKVIVGSFELETKKDLTTGPKADASASTLLFPVAVSSISTPDLPGAMPVSGNEGQQNIGGSNFVSQSWTANVVPSLPIDWRGVLDARGNANIDMTGKSGHMDDIQLQD